MSERDKIEPFWAPFGRKIRGPMFRIGARPAPPTEARSRRTRRAPAAEPIEEAAARVEPLPPALPVSARQRRETITALIADQITSESHYAPPPEEAAEPSLPAESWPPRGPPPGSPPQSPLGSPPGSPPIPRRALPAIAPPAEPAPAPTADGREAAEEGPWTYLSAEEAAKHRLAGIDGWLILVALFLGLGVIRGGVELIEFWNAVDHGGLAAWIMAVVRSVTALWAVLILGLLLARSRAFPANFEAYTAANIVYLAMFGLTYAHLTQGMVFRFVAAAILLNLLALAYVARSRRVNVTYLRRVRTKRRRAGKKRGKGG